MPREARKGRILFVALSCAMLAFASVPQVVHIWMSFRIVYMGGPTGASYVESNQEAWFAYKDVNVVADVMMTIAVAIGEVLMASPMLSSPPLFNERSDEGLLILGVALLCAVGRQEMGSYPSLPYLYRLIQ
jgi:hypothetical protein